MRTKKKKKKGVCAFQNKFTQLWIFGYKVRDFTTAPLPPCPCPHTPTPLQENQWRTKM